MQQTQPLTIGALIHQQRMKLHVSERQLALDANLPPSTVSRIERGLIRTPGLDILYKLTRRLGLSMVEVLTSTGYFDADDLPDFQSFVVTKYAELPVPAVNELVELFTSVMNRHGLKITERKPLLKLPTPSIPAVETLANDPNFHATLNPPDLSQELTDDLAGAAA